MLYLPSRQGRPARPLPEHDDDIERPDRLSPAAPVWPSSTSTARSSRGMNAERIFYLHLLAGGHARPPAPGRVPALPPPRHAPAGLPPGPRRERPSSSRAGPRRRSASGRAPSGGSSSARPSPTTCGRKILSLKVQGCRIVLLSGSLQVLVDQLKERLEAEILIGTELEVVDGRLTGRKTGIFAYGPGKIDALYKRIDPEGIDWAGSWALADRISDLPVFELVGHPVVVHGDRKLRRLARERGWEIIGKR
ncbi:MAG: haloacid dehalogenase-like hydrolase [Candidatus Moduliflexus flocculans]|nr:haloacid dehalogenase-like hydrolase [Candidatus Moduliflexus flocculans]